MKKTGFLVNENRQFASDIIDVINSQAGESTAEFISLGEIRLDEENDYDVIYDQVANFVSYFATYLRNTNSKTCKIINKGLYSNQYDTMYWLNTARNMKICIPKSVLLPSKQHPNGTNAAYMTNLKYPLDWNSIFEYVRFPAYVKSNIFGAFPEAAQVYNENEFFALYDVTGSNPVLLQENILSDNNFRIFIVGDASLIVNYFPGTALLSNHNDEPVKIEKKIEKKIITQGQRLSSKLGINCCCFDVVIKEDKPYFVNMCTNLSGFTKSILKPGNYSQLTKMMADYLISQM